MIELLDMQEHTRYARHPRHAHAHTYSFPVLQVPDVDSPVRRPVRTRASSPVDVPKAATQPPATVSTTDDVWPDTRVTTAGADRPVR